MLSTTGYNWIQQDQGEKYVIPDNDASNATYNEYDANTDEDASILNGSLSGHPFEHHLLPASEDDQDSAYSAKSSEINDSRIDHTDRENYEDLGENDELGDSEGELSDTHKKAILPRNKDRLDILSRHHRRSGTKKRVSSAAKANQLQREANESGSRRSSFESDEIYDSIDGCFHDLNGKVRLLQDQINLLTTGQSKSDEKQIRLKDENNQLVSKVMLMEEQLREMEIKSEVRLRDEQRKHREYISRQDRDKLQQMEYLTSRLQQIELECDQHKSQSGKLQIELERLKQEKLELLESLSDVRYNYANLLEDHDKVLSQVKVQNEEIGQERQATGQLLDELSKELEELRKYKIDREQGSRSRTSSVSDMPTRYEDLQVEIHRLKQALWIEWQSYQENYGLKDHNEDLNAQLLTSCMEEGRTLLKDQGLSFAEEMESLSHDQLQQALKEQQDNNMRLTQYIDKMLLTIMEKSPSILEINDSK